MINDSALESFYVTFISAFVVYNFTSLFVCDQQTSLNLLSSIIGSIARQ